MEQDKFQIFTQAHRIYVGGIRRAIAERLKSVYGDNWWERGILSAIGDTQSDNLTREMAKAIPENIEQLLDTPHFGRIVERNHAVAFADAFLNVDHTLRLFRYLSAKRNEWAHVRCGEWTVSNVMQAVQAMREILVSLRRKEALEVHQMFQESLDRQEKIPEEILNAADDSPTMDDNDRNTCVADYSLLGFWRALESYLVIESDVQADTDEEDQNATKARGMVNVLVRVTNTAPASEGRPDIRFMNVRLDVTGGETRQRGRRNETNLGTLDAGQTGECQFTFYHKELASVEFRVSGEVDQERLFHLQLTDTLPGEVVNPLLEQLSDQFETIDIEGTLTSVTGTVARIQPGMTLAEVSYFRQELAKLKPIIAEKREALGMLFEEYHLDRASQLGASFREAILLLNELESEKIGAMDNAISETDLDRIRCVADDFEQMQLSTLRARETIRELMGRRKP